MYFAFLSKLMRLDSSPSDDTINISSISGMLVLYLILEKEKLQKLKEIIF